MNVESLLLIVGWAAVASLVSPPRPANSSASLAVTAVHSYLPGLVVARVMQFGPAYAPVLPSATARHLPNSGSVTAEALDAASAPTANEASTPSAAILMSLISLSLVPRLDMPAS